MIYLIAGCTNAKKRTPKESLRIKNINFSDFAVSTKAWKKKLFLSTDKCLARDMYQGPGWKAALDSEKILSKKYKTELLVASAGYGLINANDLITAYGGTFSKAHEDSIHNFSIKNPTIQWWESINRYELDNFTKHSHIFLFLSSEYIKAMEQYLTKLIEKKEQSIYIVVISKNKIPSKLEKNILQFDTRFNSYERGTMTTLVQRCMRWLSTEIVSKKLELNQKILQNHINLFLNDLNPYQNPKRTQIEDYQLFQIINNQIKHHNISSATKGLNNLREIGYACEQNRYKKIFNSCMESKLT